MRRRDFLAATAALTATAALGRAQAPPSSKSSSGLDRLFEAFFDEDLQRSPETATTLGLDIGDRAGLKSRLNDASAAGLAAARTANTSKLKRLSAIDRTALSTSERVFYEIAVSFEEAMQRVLSFDFVALDSFAPTPYKISIVSGAYERIPFLLDSKHGVENPADADAYLARLKAFAGALDADTDRFRAAVGQGVTEPDFLLNTTLGNLTKMMVSPETSPLVTSLDRRAKAKGLGERYGRSAATIYRDLVAPALERQITAVKTALASAPHEPGVWRFKEGDAFYRALLQYTSTTTLTPEEIHQIGLDQVRQITDQMDGILKAQGLTQGLVGQRMKALYDDPAQFYPETPAGKAALLADSQARIDRMRLKLPQMFDRIPKSGIEVRAVPPAIDAGAPLAFHDEGSLDGFRPTYIYVNLHSMKEWPRFNLPTCIYHESLPGHELQTGTANDNASIPLYIRRLYLPGYGEGWATYGEQLADELGAYEDDPLGRLGWLKFRLFRAGRCVVDTGMHHMRWSRERAVEYIVGIDGDAIASTTREIDKHIAVPAQACSNMIGLIVWNRLRDRSRAELGDRFNLKAFHHAGLSQGPMPLALLDKVIADWVRSVKSA